MTRDERQALCIQRWKENKGIGTLECVTGFGKTRIGTTIIKKLLSKRNNLRVIIVVPTTTLKEQWESILFSLGCNCIVEVINTVVTTNWECDFLVLDEEHRYCAETFSQVFDKVKYKLILGLTATIERLDGKHEILKKFCPVVDQVTVVEALANGWISPYKEYEVIIDVDDIGEYNEMQKRFTHYFEFFNYDFNLVTSLMGVNGIRNKLKYRDLICKSTDKTELSNTLKTINAYSQQVMSITQAKKKFINNHPKKLEIARKIIEARPNSKIITFSNNIKMAEAIGIGKVYTGKDSKKKGRITLEELRSNKERVLNTVSKVNEGLDLQGLSVAIMLGIDSSKIKATQRIGRVIRYEEGKNAEIFNIVIADTAECKQFEKAHSGMDYITIDEEGLEAVLRGEDPKPYKKKIKDFTFRF